MNFDSFKVVVLLSLILFGVSFQLNIHQSIAEPRSDLEIVWYSDISLLYDGLKNNEVDIMGCDLPYENFGEAQENLNIQLASYDENGILEFDINNNYTILKYPNVRSPTNELKVRQAIAHLINKTYICEHLLPKFWSNPIDVPIPNSVSSWWNLSVVGFNYPYPYDPDAAAALLASLGFNDTDGNGYLNYPQDWPGIENLPSTDTTDMPLLFYIREDDEDKKAVGEYLIFQLEGDPSIPGDSPLATANWPNGFKGGDFAVQKGDPQFIPREVFQLRNYHIYTGAWMVNIFPPSYMYYMFHSRFWYPWGSNYVTGMNGNGLPNYPDLDTELEKAYFAENLSAAMYHCRKAQGLLVEKYCVSIWLWNYKEFNAYRRELVGVVPHQSVGILNPYTYLNAYMATNSDDPVRVGVESPPDKLNPLYSAWYYDYIMLDVVYPNLLSVNPYDLAMLQPWVAQDWQVGTWFDKLEGRNKTMVTLWLRKDVGCAAPQTGDLVDYFTADDLEFTVWYTYSFNECWAWYNVESVHHVKVVNEHQVEIYFDDYNIWNFYINLAGMPLLGPKDILLDKLCEVKHASFDAGELVNGEYQFTNDTVVHVINATVDGAIIEENLDFYIRAGFDVGKRNVFVNLTSFNPGQNITIYYYRAIPNGADGFYLGGNLGYDWTDIMYSYGLYYPVSIGTEAGEKVVLKKNPYFFIKTPPLGEINWRWYWEGTEKPRGGCYKIEILDIILAAAAYGTSGNKEYDPSWFPAADLDRNDLCHIGILDICVIAGNYGKAFGAPN